MMTLIRTSLLSRRAGVDLFVRAEERKPKTFRTKGSLEDRQFVNHEINSLSLRQNFVLRFTNCRIRPLSQDVFGFSLQSVP